MGIYKRCRVFRPSLNYISCPFNLLFTTSLCCADRSIRRIITNIRNDHHQMIKCYTTDKEDYLSQAFDSSPYFNSYALPAKKINLGGGEVHAVASSSNAASSEPEVHEETPVLRSQNNVHVGRKRPRALLEGGSMLTSRGSLNNINKVRGSGTKTKNSKFISRHQTIIWRSTLMIRGEKLF